MKYDILLPFKEYLEEQLSPNTARTYYAAVVKLLKNKQFNSLKELDKDLLLQNAAENFRTKAEFSAVKNGLLWLNRFDETLNIPSENEFRTISQKKRNFSKKSRKVIYLNPTRRKINQISNERLRYAYRVGLVSGLRESELADLEARDFRFKDGIIYIEVRKGKGGHGGIVECRKDSYLWERLPDFLERHAEGKVFYSASYLRGYARSLGIECHDLRRIFAIQNRNDLKKEMSVQEANEIVRQRLRHTRFSVTKRYLFNRKLRFEYEKTSQEKDGSEEEHTKL